MLVAITLSLLNQQSVDLKFVSSGMTAKMGGYSPIRAEMSEDAGNLTPPQGATNLMYGKFTFGSQSWGFAVGSGSDGTATFWLDSNGNGSFADDAAVAWTARPSGEFSTYFGASSINLNGGATVNFYRFDPKDPSRAALAKTVLFYSDFGYEGTAKFGSSSHFMRIGGMMTPSSIVFVDRNANGANDGPSESYGIGKPFNIGGKTYVMSLDGQTLNLVDSAEVVAEIPLPPNLSAGQITPNFTAKAMSGREINFPSSYKGKVVLLDFWATWCGPCIAELPNVLANYERFHPEGLEILGVSFDQENMGPQVEAFTKERGMAWEHVYEGKFWNTTIGTQFNIRGIPFMMLVDGDTGKILASGNNMRGESLGATLEKVFAERAMRATQP